MGVICLGVTADVEMNYINKEENVKGIEMRPRAWEEEQKEKLAKEKEEICMFKDEVLLLKGVARRWKIGNRFTQML